MLEPEEVGRLRKAIAEGTRADSKLLDALRVEVRNMKSAATVIKPRSTTSVSLVASDGGNNAVDFDPFHVNIVRIVDSYGKQLLTEVVSSGTDPEELSWMIPSPEDIAKDPENVATSRVLVFRELAEWAVLYEVSTLIGPSDVCAECAKLFPGGCRSNERPSNAVVPDSDLI